MDSNIYDVSKAGDKFDNFHWPIEIGQQSYRTTYEHKWANFVLAEKKVGHFVFVTH